VIALIPDDSAPLDAVEFERQLRANGHSYHIYHPFNVLMSSGRATPPQIRGWVANRFYFEACVPLMHAGMLVNCPDRDVRREWVLRILDQDGHGADPGGLEAWVRLGEAVGLTANQLWSMNLVLPEVRRAVDAWLDFARQRPWQETVCASLTELFAPSIYKERFGNWSVHYPWIETSGLEYFRSRVAPTASDHQFGLRVTLEQFRTRADQNRALEVLRYKLELLWAALEAMQAHYVPGVSAP
jgi:pyrroloquinoline-quinone synthase